MRLGLRGKRGRVALGVLAAVVALSVAVPLSAAAFNGGRYLAGDLHTHTYLTDGSHTQLDVVKHAFDDYDLDWMANSEHGGTSKRDAFGNPMTTTWRWVTLKTQSWPLIRDLRSIYPDKMLVQGVEWNVPTHEHASVAVVADEPTAVSDFEYMFDASDKDTSRPGMSKDNTSHAGAVRAAAWLQTNYPATSWFIVNHPSRKQTYKISDLRDFNNAAPDVAFGFEGLPGHQKEPGRGGYDNGPFFDAAGNDVTYRARTYGGADYMVAKVGGVWDALLGEGRRFWIFVNSDFHNTEGDFWPGEYAKSYTYVRGTGYKALVDGLRSGNSFAVHGDLIDGLKFEAASGRDDATMGETLRVRKGANVRVTIRFHVPAKNNNGDAPKVDHIDLIKGAVGQQAMPGTPAYNNETNPTTAVEARFSSRSWVAHEDRGTWYTVTYLLRNVETDSYLRLRGTNLGINVPNETDAAGNPLIDDLVGPNDAQKAYADLWFYSNPIFIDVQ
jgi:hypothetical protein